MPPAQTRRAGRPLIAWALAALLGGCANPVGPVVQERLAQLLPADVILVGEQHDAKEHQRMQREWVEALAQRGDLAALALEMAERGNSTTGLARAATPQQVRDALRWNDAGWPWEPYAPVVMAAVRQGVPVLGANLPRDAMRAAMSDARLDNHLVAAAMDRQREAIRVGHCDMLPAQRLLPMVRVQLARDASMAETVAAAVVPGKTVMLIAGGGHVTRDVGVPTHLSSSLRVRIVMAVARTPTALDAQTADMLWETPPLPPRDHCAELARHFRR